MPLVKPALATVAVFTFINSWNDSIGPLLYLSRDLTKYTVALGLALFQQTFIGRTRWDLVMAGSTLMILRCFWCSSWRSTSSSKTSPCPASRAECRRRDMTTIHVETDTVTPVR